MAQVKMDARTANRLSVIALLAQMPGAFITIGPVQVRVLPSGEFEVRYSDQTETLAGDAVWTRVQELVGA